MQSPTTSDLYFHDATAPPPSAPSSVNTADDRHQGRADYGNCNIVDLPPSSHNPLALRAYGKSIVRLAQDVFYRVGERQPVPENPPQLVVARQYRNKLGFAVKKRFHSVLKKLEENESQLRIVISQDDTLSSIMKQISNHKPIFDREGYPAWSKVILGAGREYKNHSWCQLVFQGAVASTAQSIRSDSMHLFTAYTKIQRALDIRAIEDLHDYIQVLKYLDQICERVERYGMCSTEYQVTIRTGFNGRNRQTITAGPEGCRMSETSASSFEGKGSTFAEIVVWPPPASGCHLPRYPQIVPRKVAKEVAASNFHDLQLGDVEDLQLHKLKDDDLKLLLNTQRFANGTELLANKFYFGNHVTDGFMSNLARHWLLVSAEGNKKAFRHLLLLPHRTSMDLVRVMMAAADRYTAGQVRSLCWEISVKNEVWDCCDAIASVSVPSGIVARVRLCMACLDAALFKTVQSATRVYRKSTTAGPGLFHDNQSSEELKILLRFAETDAWKLKLRAYLHLKGIGSTSHSAALYAEQVGSNEEAQKLEELVRYLKRPDRASVGLVRVMMAASDLYPADQVRSLCWEMSEKNEVWDCCDAIASASVPSGILARVRLCMICLEPGLLDAVWSATRGRGLSDDGQSSEELKILLRFAETDAWKLKLRAYLHLKRIGSTNHSGALHAGQVGSDEEAQKLEKQIGYLKRSNMRREIVDASRSFQDLEVYVEMLNDEQQADTTPDVPSLMGLFSTSGYHRAVDTSTSWNIALLRRLLSTAGYERVAQLQVPVEPGSEQQSVAAWMSSGPSDGVCMLGEIFVRGTLEERNSAPPRNCELLQELTKEARLNSSGRWENLQGYVEEKSTVSTFLWMFSETTTNWRPAWRNILEFEPNHAHVSEQIYFHMNGSELPNARGLSLVKPGNGTGDLIGQGLTITPRIAKDIWHLGGCLYYSMSRGRLWKLETSGSLYYAGPVYNMVGRFIEMSRGGLENMTIS